MNDLDILVEMFAKAGKPVVEKKSRTKPQSIDYQPIVLDINWMNDYNKATAPEARKRLRKAAQTVGGRNIANLPEVVNALNGLLEGQIDHSNHVETVAKLEIIRTLHNLLGSPSGGGAEGTKGYLFEVFMQEVFGGKVETDTKGNIVDVIFERTPVSLKFIKKGSDIEGSSDLLKSQLQDERLEVVDYIIGEKDFQNKTVEFYSFPISREYARRITDGKKRFRIKKSEAPDVNTIGTLDFSSAEAVTRKIFEDLDNRFRRLFSELQQLNAAADTLRTDVSTQKAGRGSAQATAKGKVTRKAGDVRKASQEA